MIRSKLIFSIFLIGNFLTAFSANKISTTAPPNWVSIQNKYDTINLDGSSSFQYLLMDTQDNLMEEQQFRHYAFKILNSEGVQNSSDITAEFDPTYQTLAFHQVIIKRGELIIDKLKNADIKTIQREDRMESALYDGTLTALIHLSDVRVGDIIEYSYSVNGFNPINYGNFSRTYYLQRSIPINRIYVKLISEKALSHKSFNEAVRPTINKSKGEFTYTIDVSGKDFVTYDNSVPSWYDPLKRVSFSTYSDWEDFINWAIPLYEYQDNNVPSLPEDFDDSEIDVVRYVQDEIRYLGLEEGISAYKPHSPDQVFEQRYGDCKDKSLLLVALLRKRGLEAYPVLVNTIYGKTLDESVAGNFFDHCVVAIKKKGTYQFIDPTMSNQGGLIHSLYFPDYGYGVLIKKGENQLFKLPKPKAGSTFIQEFLDLEDIGGAAGLRIKTEYRGSNADYIRSQIAGNSMESIQKDYINFYSALYPTIELSEQLKIVDKVRNKENRLVIEEYYHIPDIWKDSDDGELIYVESYPLVLETMIDYIKSAKREMPYYLGKPFLFSQETTITFPEDWTLKNSNKTIEGQSFRYENIIKAKSSREVKVTHRYDLFDSFIDGDEVSSFLDKHENIKGEFSYYITYNKALTNGFKLSWLSIIITLLSLIGSIIGFRKLYYKYDPIPWQFAEDFTIGGWLILPAFGLSITPIILLFGLLDSDMFDSNTWSGLLLYEDHKWGIVTLFGLELAYNAAYLVFTLFMIIIFFQRRTSVPLLISIFYGVGFVIPLIDALLTNYFTGDLVLATDVLIAQDSSAMRGLLACVIWIPYFNIAERSKSTFCKSLSKD